ncbi:hypothetical protein RRG08_001535 [Elysia crispata]|uniref:Uncharacterized protein n=1 Tax=Elysia crispata TaxID=231223 RepID=A0AAE1AL38_9GAST|nr:hypothetical protein RRG08_001535 [Elysia crispata]
MGSYQDYREEDGVEDMISLNEVLTGMGVKVVEWDTSQVRTFIPGVRFKLAWESRWSSGTHHRESRWLCQDIYFYNDIDRRNVDVFKQPRISYCLILCVPLTLISLLSQSALAEGWRERVDQEKLLNRAKQGVIDMPGLCIKVYLYPWLHYLGPAS